MKAINLVGKLAIRTKPVKYSNKFKDYSYTDSPIKILKVTDSHIVYSREESLVETFVGEDIRILDLRWNDNNWIDYEELINLKKVKNEKE